MNANLFNIEIPAPENSLPEGERMELVENCQRTCAKEARVAALKNPAHAFEDLEQEALLACVLASRRWSPTMGAKFNTFATSCIKRHLKNVVTNHRGEGVVRIEGWDAVPQPDREGVEEEDEVEPLSEEQEQALRRLGEPAFTVVTLLVVHKLSPEQVAVQLDLPLKDVKLIARNAGKTLPKNLRWVHSPSLPFEEVA